MRTKILPILLTLTLLFTSCAVVLRERDPRTSGRARGTIFPPPPP